MLRQQERTVLGKTEKKSLFLQPGGKEEEEEEEERRPGFLGDSSGMRKKMLRVKKREAS